MIEHESIQHPCDNCELDCDISGAISSSWEEVQAELFTPEEIAESYSRIQNQNNKIKNLNFYNKIKNLNFYNKIK